MIEQNRSFHKFDEDSTASGGDHPAGLQIGAIHIDKQSHTNGLKERADALLSSQPHILDQAKRDGKNIFALAKSHGRGLVVSAIGITLAGAIVIYEHKHHSGSETPPKDK